MKQILLVDDDDNLREALVRQFRPHCQGWQITTASNGMEALRLTATFPFDLMITDMLMPEMDGVETIMAIRREYPEVKIIAMSGGGRHVGIETLECARALGAHATLEKPFEFSTLLAHVQGLLAATPEPGQVHRRRAI